MFLVIRRFAILRRPGEIELEGRKRTEFSLTEQLSDSRGKSISSDIHDRAMKPINLDSFVCLAFTKGQATATTHNVPFPLFLTNFADIFRGHDTASVRWANFFPSRLFISVQPFEKWRSNHGGGHCHE